uniref:Solute carrier family 5 member 10 n=1 Tax=Oncorhynchus mykiss TaxID=8022 RepID=A0A8L0DVR7_ONCMY
MILTHFTQFYRFRVKYFSHYFKYSNSSINGALPLSVYLCYCNSKLCVCVCRDVNRCLMELCVMAYGCVTACARSVCGVLPYLPYSKQCKMRKRGSIVCKLIASLMCRAGLTHLITVDLHQKEIQGFFNIPVDNLRASPFLLQYIQEEIPDYHNAVIVAKSPSSAKRAQSLAERLRVSIAVIHGDAETDLLDGRHSPPTVRTTGGLPELPFCIPKEKHPITVVGDVAGRIAIIVVSGWGQRSGRRLCDIVRAGRGRCVCVLTWCVCVCQDDIIDDAVGFVAAAEMLRERGAGPIIAMATHAILSADAPRILQESAISQVVVTNTIPHSSQKLQCCKIKTVDVSLILSEAVRRIHCGESMSCLFHNIGADD